MVTKYLIACVTAVGVGTALSAAAWLGPGDGRAGTSRDTVSPRVPVLVELFTSEGCSSCPPADTLLRQLDETQPVAGAEVIVLSEHVDYWNRLGWTDPFSSADFTARQEQYVTRLRAASLYTPQAVIDGAREAIGNDRATVIAAVAAAAAQPKGTLTVQVQDAGDGALAVSVTGTVPGAAGADVFVAVAERGLTVHVTGGENARKTLRHTGVVRRLTRAGRIDAKGALDVSPVGVALDRTWQRQALRVVAFAQGKSGGPVSAIGVADVPVR